MAIILRCFTDGASKGNSKKSAAAWAYYFPKQGHKGCGSFYGTNNQAEIKAVIEALKICAIMKYKKPSVEFNSVLIITDSKYVIGITEGNKINVNKDLIDELFKRRDMLHCKVGFEYVEAHTRKKDYVSECNAVVDKLASDAAKELNKTGELVTKHWIGNVNETNIVKNKESSKDMKKSTTTKK